MTESKLNKKGSVKVRWWRSASTNKPPVAEKFEPVNRKWHSEENMLSTSPSSVPYYYGHITRENAELIIWDRGCLDGMYLLRASHNRDAEYVLSVGSGKQVLHYLIQKNGEGMYHLCGMSTDTFIGPVELIETIHPSSLPCLLRIPCLKPVNVFMPGVNCGITKDRLHEALQKKATEWGISDDEMKSMLINKENDVWKLIFKTLHESEGWFHGKISRSEGESRLAKSGHKNGKFLIRERDTSSFSLSLSFNNQIKHYKIEVLSTGEVGIPEGPRFENIISLVSHYSVFMDGLWCCLKYPCLNLSISSTTPTKEISWPMERGNSFLDNSFESQAAFPSNRPIFSPTLLGPENFLYPNLSKESEPESSKVLPNDVIGKLCHFAYQFFLFMFLMKCFEIVTKSEEAPVKKFFPLRPPPPPPVKGKAVVHRLPVIEGTSSKPSVRKESNSSKNDSSPPKVPSIIKDQNHNDCDSNISSENICSSGDKSKQKPLPVPRRRKVPVTLNIPNVELENQNGKVLETITSDAAGSLVSPRTIQNISPPTREGLIPSPSFLNNNNNSKSTTNGSKSPNLAASKQIAGHPVAPSSLINVMAELKNHKVMNVKKDKPNSPPAKSSEVTISITDIKKMFAKNSPPISSPQNNSHPPLKAVLSEPNYEEIDPEYESKEDDNQIPQGSPTDDGPQSLMSLGVQESKWDDLEENSTISKSFTRKPPWTQEESELHFKTIKRCRTSPAVINRKNLVIQERLGYGNFGEVSKALFKSGTDEVPCAVKTLRPEHIANGKEEILREARIMTKMDHPHIVRLHGISEGEPFLLVMELAPLGPLSAYLKRNPNIPIPNIMNLIYQVSLGMEYLESRQFVHRDLAARNVLLVNDNFAKITDFGMSKALGLHSDYYTVEPQGRLPLKWYAPECIYYFKFSSKSDVWSFGITMWEALSRGGKPYMGMTGREILRMFSDNTRLQPPENCPHEMYEIMKKCWELRAEDRPSFSELVLLLQAYQIIS